MTHQISLHVEGQSSAKPVDMHTPEGAMALFVLQEASRKVAAQILQQDPPLDPMHFGPHLGVISPEEQAERLCFARHSALTDV